jgi:ABC-type dipeptide/oligopeptide/nickel transport system permease subunit
MKPAVLILALVLLAALAAPWLTPWPASGATADAAGERLANRHQPPSSRFPLGTDELGRDVLTRVLHGARLSLAIGLAARLVAVVVGGLVGAAAGYFGGAIDFVASRIMELFLAFPSLILAIGIGCALGPGPATVVLAIVAVSWVDVAVLIRATSSSVARRDFVAAARAQGESDRRILFRHIIPNCLPQIVVSFTFGIASAVMIEASLSFLGLGITGGVDQPSWGWMIYTAEYHLAAAPWAVFAPGLALALTVFAWNLLGDALRDRLDVRAEIAG